VHISLLDREQECPFIRVPEVQRAGDSSIQLGIAEQRDISAAYLPVSLGKALHGEDVASARSPRLPGQRSF
jgi:hypothetical protein